MADRTLVRRGTPWRVVAVTTADEVLLGLDERQREAAQCLQGPLLIKAGPGSGKTGTVTRRIAYGVRAGVFDPARTMALTFTTRAAGELHQRLGGLGAGAVATRTFHSAALRQLRHFWADAVGGDHPRVESRREPMVASALAAAGLAHDSATVSAVLTELDWCKARGVAPADYVGSAGGRRCGRLPAESVAVVLAGYEQEKTTRGVIDFDDVLLITVAVLQARSDIRESVRRAYRWFTVDEYQDVSPLQQRLLDLWVGDHPQLCVVGDPAQSIYQFAGADPTLIAGFPQRYADATVVELDRTYRCSRAIAASANAIATGIPHAMRLAPGADAAPGSVQVLQFPSDAAEVRGVVDEIASLIRTGHPPDQIVVLARINHQAARFADELRDRGIGFSMRGGDHYFDRGEMREAVTRLRGEVRTDPAASATQAWDSVMTAMSLDAEPPPRVESVRRRWESLAAVARMAESVGTAADLLADLDRRAADNDPPPAAGVSVLTLHAAKGLEWDTVFVVGAWDGMLPFSAAADPAAHLEETRLAYVGVTRARNRLVATWAVHGGSGQRRRPSPFLRALTPSRESLVRSDQLVLGAPEPVASHGPDDGETSSGVRLPPARCRVCGKALVTGRERVLGRCDTCPAAVDESVLDRLLLWREARAMTDHVPLHVVLTDASLRAVAELQPSDARQLRAIPGLTDHKAELFGDEVLAAVRGAADLRH